MGQSPLPRYAAGGYVKSPAPGCLTEPGAPERLLSYSDFDDLLKRIRSRQQSRDTTNLRTPVQPTRRCPGCGSYDYVLSKARGSYVCKFYRDWETDRKSTRLNSSHSAKSRMPSSA